MAITEYFVDPAINANSGTGTIGDPFGDLQFGLNTVTRDSTNGDKFNIKAGTAEILAASLTLATYGTPALGKPLILRGYTNAANDGGMGVIDCGGSTMFASSALAYVHLIDLECHSFGNNNGISAASGGNFLVIRCKVHKGASSPSEKALLNLGTAGCHVVGCYVYDAGTTGTGILLNSGQAMFNYVANCPTGIASAALAIGNVVNVPSNGTGITCLGQPGWYVDNIVYCGAGSTGDGILLAAESASRYWTFINNIVAGFSGVGGVGITVAAGDAVMVGYNAFYNNTANYSVADVTYMDLTANDVSLGADPFTDAANGDFSLTETAKTALRSLGWPASYLGAHANSDPHITIGAMQYGPAVTAGGMGGIFGSIVK